MYSVQLPPRPTTVSVRISTKRTEIAVPLLAYNWLIFAGQKVIAKGLHLQHPISSSNSTGSQSRRPLRPNKEAASLYQDSFFAYQYVQPDVSMAYTSMPSAAAACRLESYVQPLSRLSAVATPPFLAVGAQHLRSLS